MSLPEFARVLTIAGSDPSGGAGLQADLRTITSLGGYGMAIPTAITVQNTRGVLDVHHLPPAWLVAQLQALASDVPPRVIKLGMLGNQETLAHLFTSLQSIQELQHIPVVCDPVLVSSSGRRLLSEAAEASLVSHFSRITLLTPNTHEATVLSGIHITSVDQMLLAAQRLLAMGLFNVLIKGGHLAGETVGDLLLSAATPETPIWFQASRVHTQNDHGTGCTLSAAIATLLAKGMGLNEAVAQAKQLLTAALRYSQPFWNGEGQGGFMLPVSIAEST